MRSKRQFLLKILKAAERKYGAESKRLAAEEWPKDWQTLIATIMSAQSRDETTLPIAESLFKRYGSLEKLAKAKYQDVLKIFKRLNYNRTKAKHVILAAKFILKEFGGKLPDTVEELTKIPGVGRKTANITLIEVHKKDVIAVDTHVHRLSNVLGLVNTKTPEQTEFALMELVPKRYWGRINRLFVLWGQDIPGRDKKKLLDAIDYKN